MALEEYRRKRDFRKTPEPAGAPSPGQKIATSRVRLSYVIQKHAAHRLHYDFRLEFDGVLKSWAVPKGPSLDPGEKRLAVEVEDHPLEYGGFEGVIPGGEYGGGTVMLWDRGNWLPADPDPMAAYHNGMIKFALHGEKLQGDWVLVRIRGGKKADERQRNWLLIKERDATASPGSGNAVVADHPLSVDSGRSLDEIAADRDRVWHSAQGESAAVSQVAATKPRRPAVIPGARKAKMPEQPKPQLAGLGPQAPDGDDWLHEIKYDGYRLLARIEHGGVRLITRGGLDWTAKFPELAQAFAGLGVDAALIDGEIVSPMPDGTTNFSALQDAIAAGATGTLVFFAFDLLHRDGLDLTVARLEDRKVALTEMIPPQAQGMLRYSDHQIGQGPAVLRQACRLGLEGIVSKRRDAPYRAGRSVSWLKLKCGNRAEFVVVGFTDPAASREGFGALLLGCRDAQQDLRYAGRVGTGFSTAHLLSLRQRLDALRRRDAAFPLSQSIPLKGVHWVEPRLVAEISFAGWTADAVLRQASFQGLREDKDAAEIICEAIPPTNVSFTMRDTNEAAPRSPAPAASQRARDGSLEFSGVRLSHPDRVLYPDQDLTKLDLAHYYAAVADWALPHLGHRPLTLVRSPGGQGKKSFYQKHVGAGMPKAIGHVDIADEENDAPAPVVEDLAGLISLVQMNVLEIHPWGAGVDGIETPDRVTFDLDPDTGLPWQRVIEAALGVRAALAGIGFESFVKTTGGKGLHVVAPLAPKLGWDPVKAFTRWVAEQMAEQSPAAFTVNQSLRARHDRIYIDYLRNGRGATAIGAYSPRARPGAPVSTPLFWHEVEQGLRPDGLTVATLPGRLAALKIDPWAQIGKLRQSIGAALRRRIGI